MVLKRDQRKAMPKRREEAVAKHKLSKYIKKKPKFEISKRENTYVFEGFYEKLKQIDVKHSHSMEANFTYDRLLEEKDLLDGEDSELFRSNFIQLLRSEKANNKTKEFGKVYSDIERFCFSYPLLIHNKTKIVERLLSHLQSPDAQKVVQAGVIELFIALIKDFRSEIYQDFLSQIMPSVIGALDISNVILVDKIFTLMSFGVKYLTKSIKDDLENFYQTYIEMLTHRNKFVKKFAAQSFCYVIRKLPFDNRLLSIILKPIVETQDSDTKRQRQDVDIGISELLFEVVYGASEGLHSRAKELLTEVLKYGAGKRPQGLINVIRQLIMRLVNEVDTEKHQLIYETMSNGISWKEDEAELNLLLVIIQDIIKLKQGRRVSPYAIVSITEVLNSLLHSQLQKTVQLQLSTKVAIGETLCVLYYYKHHQVLSLFTKSNMDFQSSKHLFNHYLYQLCSLSPSDEQLPILRGYLSLFLLSSSQVAAFVETTADDDLDWGKLLGLQINQRKQMEFSEDSHSGKLRLLLKSLTRHILKQVSNPKLSVTQVVEHLAIFEGIAQQVGDGIIVEIGGKEVEQRLTQVINVIKPGTPERYVLYKFIARVKVAGTDGLVKALANAKEAKEQIKGAQINVQENVRENFVLKHYADLNIKQMETTASSVLDLANSGDEKKIDYQIQGLKTIFLQRNSSLHKENSSLIVSLLTKHPEDIVLLRAFNLLNLEKPLNLDEVPSHTLFKSLSENLKKNQRELRLETLKALSGKFEKLDVTNQDAEQSHESDIIDLMLQFEELKVAFETEKGKILQIERLKSQIESLSVPEKYLEVIYNFLIGCFWIKFTPIFPYVQGTLQILLREHKNLFVEKSIELLQNLGYLTQLAHDNETLYRMLGVESASEDQGQSLAKQVHARETNLCEDFMDMKDFFYNIGKSLCIATILESKDFRGQFMDVFFNFIDCEYTPLHFSRHSLEGQAGATQDQGLLDRMTFANMVDSEDYKKFRRQAYSKLYCFLELLQKAENLKKVTRIADLQKLMMRLLNTNDSKLQKLSLDCILKSDEKGILRQYRKLLEGFTDDIKFKDMIPVVTFGSQGGSVSASTNANQQYAEDDALKKQDAKANNIPKLAEGHRMEVLPLIIKLLLSKLIKKKGAINMKTVHTRRSIVYNFMANLDPETELKLFFNELFHNFDLTIDEFCLIDTTSSGLLRDKLSQASFNSYVNFIGSFEIILKQMGGLLARNGYLEKVTFVFVQVLSLTKLFIRHLKLSIADEKNVNEESEDEPMSDEGQDGKKDEVKDSLYRFVGHQSKTCIRKGLGIVKQIYDRYSSMPSFIKDYSRQIYKEVARDQIMLMKTNFISDRSQLIEILTISWSSSHMTLQNYQTYPDVFRALLGMLGESKINPEVYELHLTMLKSIVLKSIQGLEDKKDLAFLYKKSRNHHEDSDEDTANNPDIALEREVSQKIIKTFIQDIASALNAFCQNNLSDLKKTLLSKKRKSFVPGMKPTVHEVKGQTIKDLIIVMSEVANYLKEGEALNQNFLEMIVSVVGMKNLHSDSGFNSYYEELLHFGVKSLANLMTKVPHVEDVLLDKIFQMFLTLKSLRIRQSLAQGLTHTLSKRLEPEALSTIVSLTKLKRGAADLELDYDHCIKIMQGLIEDPKERSILESQAIGYIIISLIANDEFSVRDYAGHYIKQVMLKSTNQHLLQLLEQTLVRGLGRPADEMILKTNLEILRYYITQAEESQLSVLSPLVNLKEDNEDFFAMFLGIKLKTRQKSLKLLQSKLASLPPKAVQAAILPLINYVIFGDAAQKQNRRNTISYTKEERRATLEEALNVYQVFASTLKWSEYFRLIKALLYKLQRVAAKSNLASVADGGKAYDEELVERERTVTKCICRVLNGFNCESIPDSGEQYLKLGWQAPLAATENQEPKYSGAEIGLEFEEVLKRASLNNEDAEESDDDIPEEVVADEEMDGTGISGIQTRLMTKVLPILERHLTESKSTKDEDGQPVIRSFVVMSIIKLLRRMPITTFQHGIGKLVSTIVSKGLRQRELNCREKGRKALLKLVEELTPRPVVLCLIFQEMKDQLQKGGYQLHTFVYSVHFIIQQLHEQKLIHAGDISLYQVELLADKFLQELFISSSGVDGTLEDVEKVKIKESKSKKAIPVFEFFAQYIDFRTSFFGLIAPVMKALEENPSMNKISQCEELLNRLSNSLLKNESVKGDELLMFLYTVIQRGVGMAVKVKINDDRGVERDYGAKMKDVFLRSKAQYKELTYSVDMKWHKTSQQLTDKKTQEICGRVLGSFGLQCLKRALKTTSLILKPSGNKDEEATELKEDDIKAKLDPFVNVLLDAFKTYHNPIIVTTLHVLGQLIPLGLPSFKDLMKKFLNKLFKLFETTGASVDSDFLNSLFKCTAELIRSYATYQDLTQPQLKTLVTIIKANLSTAATQTNVFHCLRALVYRRFVCADLYDLIESVQDMMITSLAKSTRGICASIFTQFLLEYPLEAERVEQHINHLVKNLGYFDSEGRLQVLDVMHSLLERFPKELTDQYAEVIFFTLVLRVVNETNGRVRERVNAVIKRLMIKSSQAKVKTLFNTVVQMQESGSEVKRRQISLAKQIILGIYSDSQGSQLKLADAQKVLEVAMHLVTEQAIKIVESKPHKEDHYSSEEEKDEKLEVKNPEMKSFLKNIDLMQEDAAQVPQLQQFTIDFEEEKHTSSWSPLFFALKNLESLLFSAVAPQLLAKNHELTANLLLLALHNHTYWIRLGVQRVFGSMFQVQMKNPSLSTLQILAVSSWKELTDIMYKMSSVFKFRPQLDEELGQQLVKNLTFLLREALTHSKDKEFLPKLFGRCSFFARKIMLNVQVAKPLIANVLLFFQVAFHLFKDLNDEKLEDNSYSRAVVEPVLELVYRIYTDQQYADSQAKELAFELVDYLSNGLDKTFFINTYNLVKANIQKKRLERKKLQKVAMASADGAKIKERKRKVKLEKKKLKNRDKIMNYELRKN